MGLVHAILPLLGGFPPCLGDFSLAQGNVSYFEGVWPCSGDFGLVLGILALSRASKDVGLARWISAWHGGFPSHLRNFGLALEIFALPGGGLQPHLKRFDATGHASTQRTTLDYKITSD